MTAETARWESVQYMRAISVIGIMVFHFGQRYGYRITLGMLGVDMFFIISGLIMWLTTAQGSHGFWGFMKKRLTRIVPLYWLASFVVFGLAWVYPNAFPTVELEWRKLLYSLLFIPYTNEKVPYIAPVVLQGWTLNIEMFFYLAFALALVFSPLRRLLVLGGFLWLCVLCGLDTPPNEKPPVSRLYTSTFLLDFLGGMLLGYALTHTRLRFGWWVWGALYVGAAAIWVQLPLGAMPGLSRTLLVSVPMLLVMAAAVYLEKGGLLPRIKWLGIVGDASYSIYLWHLAMFPFVMRPLHRALQDPLLELSAAVLLVTAAGVATYYLLEVPLLRLIRRLL